MRVCTIHDRWLPCPPQVITDVALRLVHHRATPTRKPDGGSGASQAERLVPLKSLGRADKPEADDADAAASGSAYRSEGVDATATVLDMGAAKGVGSSRLAARAP